MFRSLLLLLCLLCAPACSWTQASTSTHTAKPASLHATISDPSGARVGGAAVHITSTDGAVTRDTTTDDAGRFSADLPPGKYNVVVTAPGFDPYFRELRLNAGASALLDARLIIATGETVVQVNGNTSQLSTEADANKDALTFSGDQLSTFSDDDATFQQQLLAVAGGDGSHAPQVYVDGFSGGQFPPKSSIREVKINQNPFSAEYDSLGFGRIEISTKPGTGAVHGQLEVFGDPSQFNSQNPFIHAAEPGYYRVHTRGDISGPIDKKTSFFLSADYYNQQNNAVIVAQTVAPGSNALVSVNSAVPDPQTTANYTARIDRQWSKNNTFTGRYEYDRVVQTNGGIGPTGGSFGQSGPSCMGSAMPYTLSSQAFHCVTSQHTVQLGNTQVLGAHGELNTRFEWIRAYMAQDPNSDAPSISVGGTVSDGGSGSQALHDHADHFEFQIDGTYERGKHFIRTGFRDRIYRDANLSTANYNGTFTFNTLADYQASVDPATGAGLATGAKAAQFSITTGQSAFRVLTNDLAFWAEDEVRLTKSLTGDFGFRFESQTAIPDHFDPSPHFGLAWAPGATSKKPAPIVYRIGSGIFYDRFPISSLLTAVRQNNPTLQTTYTVQNPDFFARSVSELHQVLPDPSSLGTATEPTRYRVAPDLRSQYEIATGASMEISLGKHGSLAINYLNTRGVHQWVSRNANAPLADGSRPLGNTGELYEFSSGGENLGNFFFTHPQVNFGKNIVWWGFFILQHFSGDSGGLGNFASNSYNIHQDYGRAAWDRRAAAFTGIDANLKYGLHAGFFLAARGPQPFNITTGTDTNGDTTFNDRPSYATTDDIANDPTHIVQTPYGTFHTQPAAGENPIPAYIGHGHRFVSLQVTLQETIKFGPRKADPDAPPPPAAEPGKPAPLPDPRYALVFSLEAQNITNTVNPASPIGVLNSPYFNQSISSSNGFLSTSAANRTLTLHTAFRF